MALLFALIHQEKFMGTSRNKGSKVKNTNQIPLLFFFFLVNYKKFNKN